MARPVRIPIESGIQGWDGVADDNLEILFNGPLPIHENASLTESNLQSTFPAASYDRCLVWVNHTVVGHTLYWSNGTTWRPFGPRKPKRESSATISQGFADVWVRFTGAGSVDYDMLPAASWAGLEVTIRNDAGAAINLDPNGSETINGAGAGVPLSLASGSTATVYSDGTALYASVAS